ncbi:dinitrogenase iron-molybdenum cofactor biosynthesis protein [Methanomicrobiaceae archaeon CYW5]|nr:dinitrogenase iron-molybdenum cofactor biosynthesis protein [Methanovulcanius yangii]
MADNSVRLGIATESGYVSAHFGHCSEYTLVTIENGTIVSNEMVRSPGHTPGALPAFLAGHGVTHVIAGGMGPRAVDLFCEQGIEVLLGVEGPVEDIPALFISGSITQGESMCHHEDGHHECSHE